MNGIEKETFVGAKPDVRDAILFDMFTTIWNRMDRFEKRIWGYVLAMVMLIGEVAIK
jgi:hypothetical protein